MKKFFYTISFFIYVILLSILYKNYLLSNEEYIFRFHKINSSYIIILLALKFLSDLFLIIKKDKKVFSKIANTYVFLLILIFIFFIPSSKNETKLLGDNLTTMLNLNKVIFLEFFENKSKLPSKDYFKKLVDLDLGNSPYLKKGNKEYKYHIYVRYYSEPILNSKGAPPGSFFIVVNEKENDFYITASILDPISKKVSMLAVNNETVILNKNINLDNMKDISGKLKFAQDLILNTKK